MRQNLRSSNNPTTRGSRRNSRNLNNRLSNAISIDVSGSYAYNVSHTLKYIRDRTRTSNTIQSNRVRNSRSLSREQGQSGKKDEKDTNGRDNVLYIPHLPKIDETKGNYKKFEKKLRTTKKIDKNKLLVVFDMNGVLIRREDERKTIVLRPWLTSLLEYCIENYNVVFWSSVKPYSMLKILDKILPDYQQKLIRVYVRNHCTLEGSYNKNCLTVKDLNTLWMDLNFELKSSIFNDRNTIIIDDCATKCKLQPNNHVLPEIYEYIGEEEESGELHYLKHYLKYTNEEYHKNINLFDVKRIIKNIPFAYFKELCLDANNS